MLIKLGHQLPHFWTWIADQGENDVADPILGGVVPDLRGRTLREAAAEASALGMVLSVEGSGLIRSQEPLPGARIRRGETLLVRATEIRRGG